MLKPYISIIITPKATPHIPNTKPPFAMGDGLPALISLFAITIAMIEKGIGSIIIPSIPKTKDKRALGVALLNPLDT
jgi:hypothetical protein